LSPKLRSQLEQSLARAKVQLLPWSVSYRWMYEYGDRILKIDFSLGSKNPTFYCSSERPVGHDIQEVPGRFTLSELRFFLADARARLKEQAL